MGDRLNILLIEDNKEDVQLINTHLREAFPDAFSLYKAEWLRDGLEMLRKHDYDIIIVDLSLPDSNGLNTFRKVFKGASEKPIIVLTSLEDEALGMATMKLGAQDFLIRGKLSSKSLKRSVNYSIERFKLLKSLAENARMLEEKSIDLLNEKQKLAQAQKLAHVGSWEWNIQQNKFNCSDELYRILKVGPSVAGLTYAGFIAFIHPEDRERVQLKIDKAIKSRKPFEFVTRIVRKDGTVRHLQTWGRLVTDRKGGLSKITGTVQDITQRKKEEQLEQLALVALKSFNAVTIANKEGRIEWVNEGFTKLFGYKLKDVKGTYGEVLRRGEKTGLSPGNEFYQVLMRDKKPLSYENKNYSKSGEEYWVLTSLTPILDGKGDIEKIISIDSDITRRKKAEQELIVANQIAEHSIYKGNKALEELHKAKQEVEESLKVKEQFLANMSHEIRTPMNAIIGFTNLLLKMEQSPESKQYLNAIKTSGENLLVIINDILDFSKLELGKITIEHIPFKLGQLISTVIDLMLPKAIEKSIKVSSAIDKRIPEVLTGDPTRLNQVLINLVGNAIKFTDKGGVRISANLMEETDEEVKLRFSVTDTGIGIPKESLDKIFEGFTQASSDTTRKYGGTGLGLTITKQLVELQGGEISVTSKINEGSSFIFWLRFRKEAHQEKFAPSDNDQDGNKFPLEQVKVLLVEDNLFNQMLAAKILENWHCQVEVADNGLIAVEKAKAHNFDLVLMDIQLPEMDGYQATQHIRTRLPAPKSGVPIIAMTAHAFAEEVEKCKRYGMDDYISKPFDENKLYGKIVKVLQEKRNHVFNHSEKAPTAVRPGNDASLVNLSYLQQVSNEDTVFVLKMINVFLNQTPLLLNLIDQHVHAQDWKSLAAVLHKMKPSVAFMGITALDELIMQAEKNLQNKISYNELPAICTRLKETCSQVTEELEAEKVRLESR